MCLLVEVGKGFRVSNSSLQFAKALKPQNNYIMEKGGKGKIWEFKKTNQSSMAGLGQHGRFMGENSSTETVWGGGGGGGGGLVGIREEPANCMWPVIKSPHPATSK